MKIAFLIFILVGITFLGCSDNFDSTFVTAPTNTDNLTKNGVVTSDPEFNPISPLFVSKLIDGAIGGRIILDATYINSEGRLIKVYARINFPAGSFQGTIEFGMAPNDGDLSIQFSPEMAFDKIVKLDFVFTGIDLKAFGYTTNGQVDFVYFDDNGNIEQIENQRSAVNVHHNRISVRGGKLVHFSRYGWVR